MKFKKFTFNPLSIMIGIHYGRNPVSGTRFLHVAPVPFFGIDFWWPEDHEQKGITFGGDSNIYRTPTSELKYPLTAPAIPGDPGPLPRSERMLMDGEFMQVYSDVSHEEADNIAQVILGNLDPFPGESYDDYSRRSVRAEMLFRIQYPNWNPPTRAGATREGQGQ